MGPPHFWQNTNWTIFFIIFHFGRNSYLICTNCSIDIVRKIYYAQLPLLVSNTHTLAQKKDEEENHHNAIVSLKVIRNMMRIQIIIISATNAIRTVCSMCHSDSDTTSTSHHHKKFPSNFDYPTCNFLLAAGAQISH